MGLFESIFGKKTEQQKLKMAETYFKTLTAYQPVFRTWNGSIYESELVRSAIDARARHIAKLKVEIIGSARPTLQAKLKSLIIIVLTFQKKKFKLKKLMKPKPECITQFTQPNHQDIKL